jgi:hypothetical protein
MQAAAKANFGSINRIYYYNSLKPGFSTYPFRAFNLAIAISP